MSEKPNYNEELSDNFEDALKTLASAATERNLMLLPKEESMSEPSCSGSSSIELIELPWHDVGIFKNTTCVVKHFYFSATPINHTSTTSDFLPNYINVTKIELCPGTAYKFRIAALNACGRGEWSDVSAFNTCLPGFPGAPCSIRISRSAEGARLQWKPPTVCSGKITEYSLCLAIKKNGPHHKNTSLKDLPFVRVYCGVENNAFVDNSSLKVAYVDQSAKPAIIFRIAAKNEKGYGSATQVRWLQDMSSVSKNSDQSTKNDRKE